MFRDATERKLHPELFHKIVDKFEKPDIYLFASKIKISSRIKGYGI